MGINTTFPPSSHITVSEKGYSVLHGPLLAPTPVLCCFCGMQARGIRVHRAHAARTHCLLSAPPPLQTSLAPPHSALPM